MGTSELQGDLGRPNDFTVIPGLTVNRDFTTGSNSIQERLAVASRSNNTARNAGYQQGTFPIGDGDLVDSSLFSKPYDAKQVLPARVSLGHRATVVHELLRIRTVRVHSPNGLYRTPLLFASYVNTQRCNTRVSLVK